MANWHVENWRIWQTDYGKSTVANWHMAKRHHIILQERSKRRSIEFSLCHASPQVKGSGMSFICLPVTSNHSHSFEAREHKFCIQTLQIYAKKLPREFSKFILGEGF